MALTKEDKIEIEIIVNRRLANIMDDLLGEFGRFVNEVSARQLIEAIKNRSRKEAERLQKQTTKAKHAGELSVVSSIAEYSGKPI